MIDTKDWVSAVDEIYKQCGTEDMVKAITKWMIKYLKSKEDLAKHCVKQGC